MKELKWDDTPTTDWWLCDTQVSHWLLDIGDWPRWLRRAFLMTLPVSFPLLLAVSLIYLCGVFATLPIDAARHIPRLWRM